MLNAQNFSAHPINILQQIAMAIKQTYMILLSAKLLCCHLNPPQSETLPKQHFFFIIVADDKVSWKQNHTPELINADLEVPVQGDDLLGRNSNSLHCQIQLVLS